MSTFTPFRFRVINCALRCFLCSLSIPTGNFKDLINIYLTPNLCTLQNLYQVRSGRLVAVSFNLSKVQSEDAFIFTAISEMNENIQGQPGEQALP